MLYMREDDMDEMLRKAAENYEVDAKRAADWEAVYAAVHKTEEFPEMQRLKTPRQLQFHQKQIIIIIML